LNETNESNGANSSALKELLMQEILTRLQRIEAMLENLHGSHFRKDFYTIAEVAEIVDRSEYTVREWCRLGRVHGEKSQVGCGSATEWRISHDELERIRNEGPLPMNPR